jgi:hypothetical protein
MIQGVRAQPKIKNNNTQNNKLIFFINPSLKFWYHINNFTDDLWLGGFVAGFNYLLP